LYKLLQKELQGKISGRGSGVVLHRAVLPLTCGSAAPELGAKFPS
jgi:hypothetical protein